ncbi:MAG: type I restriction-modification system endonuclease [Polyangiales bacterium]
MRAPSPNFTFLKPYDERLVLLAAAAERAFHDDPVVTLIRLRQFGEVLAQEAAAHFGLYQVRDETQAELLRRLSQQRGFPRDVGDLFHRLKVLGNKAVHENVGNAGDALHALKLARAAAVWFHQSFGDRGYRPGAFVPPRPPDDASAALKAAIAELRAQLAASQSEAEKAQKAAEDAAFEAMSAGDRARAADAERAALAELLDEVAERQAAMLDRLARLQAEALAAPPAELERVAEQAEEVGTQLALDEADTRQLIDAQLRDAGWEADSVELRYSRGVRPQKHKNLAIAEWPTDSGPADYVLFVGLEAVSVIEAKRAAKDVAASIEQAKRYSRAYTPKGDDKAAAGPWDGYRIPFLFATNGRPYLKQLATKSGIWFLDARRKQNHSHALDGWYTPEGLSALLRQDMDEAHRLLAQEPTDYLALRDYQVSAIKAAEACLEKGQREILIAMATGTGKTMTCIGLCYRLLKSKRFRRILFLVDRSALGVQTTNAFKSARLENLLTFGDIFGIKELTDIVPDSDTKLHIATVQGMVKRLLYSDDAVPPVDSYDCIVVDECHRGYVLDRELSDAELTFRNEADYISKYRRVLEHFDATKIGLTATPAVHTVEIFGEPAFKYTYREAVIDNWLIDHEPPTRIVTALAEDGIHFQAGEEVEQYVPATGQLQLSLLPDAVSIEVEQFNKRVLTEGFNRAVCHELAKHIDPSLEEKTLVFCATDVHADMVVTLLKDAFRDVYGAVDDDAVVKITGTADKPLDLIRRYRNEREPNVVVTVDLLTTGVDIPRICNIVFLRRVRSRILYEQMLGRATRRCDEIGKEVFRIYDAVDLYKSLAPYTDMKPVVTNPSVPFTQLIAELGEAEGEAARDEVLDQLLAKLGRKSGRLKGDALERFEAAAGVTPKELLAFLRQHGAEAARVWFAEHPLLGEVLDRATGDGGGMLVSHHPDEVRRVEHGYGAGTKPDDYLAGFAKYVTEHLNDIPALLVVTQRPRSLTRQQLKELRLALDRAGYTSASLRTAWRDKTNQDIAASIMGYIRQAALGDALVPYEERVARALKKVLASQPWTPPQRQWLERIGKQLTVEHVVDKDALDQGQFKAKGGFDRLNKTFDGKLEQILGDLSDALWEDEAG